MPVTFLTPPANGPFGPGILVNAQTDFIGPIPAGSSWELTLLASDNETFWSSDPPILSQSTTVVKTYGVEGTTDWRSNPPFSGYAHGAIGHLHAKLKDNTGATIDEGQTPVTVDLISGMSYILTALLSTSLRNSTFPAEDFTTMQGDVSQIKAASFGSFGNIQVPISQLLQAPPLGFLRREQIVPDRTGEGDLTRPSGPVAVDAFGIAWEFVDVAEGIGVNEGAPDTLYTTPLQLNLIHTLGDGSLENTTIGNFSYGDALWLFNPMLPTVVRYWIGPGITVRFFWLII